MAKTTATIAAAAAAVVPRHSWQLSWNVVHVVAAVVVVATTIDLLLGTRFPLACCVCLCKAAGDIMQPPWDFYHRHPLLRLEASCCCET